MAKRKYGKKEEEPVEEEELPVEEEIPAKPPLFGSKTPKSINVKYVGSGGTMRHSGRTNSDYVFSGGIPLTITKEADIAFFMLKAKNNPDTWQVG